MVHLIKVLAVAIVVGLVAQWLWRRGRTAQQRAICKLAAAQFQQQQESLPSLFLEAANATGKPRGLRWRQCELHAKPLFATDRVTDEPHALVGATVSFEAIEGGDMEEVEAVGNLRFATLFFAFRQNQWTTDGRAAFNLEPEQALQRFSDNLTAFV